MTAAVRVWLLGLLAAGAWLLTVYGAAAPVPLKQDAPARVFSAARAETVLSRLLGDQKPHPAGSAENRALHQRLMDELARLGVKAETISGMSCEGRRAVITCATVSDVVGEAVPGEGKAILLMAHMDSVPAGPGAGDDESGVATLLESIRALRQAGSQRHPVILLVTDGEELGLLGAALFLRHPEWRNRVGVVINAEARGNRGPSYLFQTSAGDGRLVDLYAASVARPATSSLYSEIYKYLPNDTDLTPFLKAGFTAYNFAFIGGQADYHTAQDRLENLSPVSLQSQGDNVLGLARGLENSDFAGLKGDNAIYFDVLRSFLPRLPGFLALPLALLAFGVIAFLAWRRRRPGDAPGWAAILMPPLLLLSCLVAGFLLSGIAALISGEADPSFAHPLALRLALSAGCWAMALLAMRGATATACWLWLAGFGVLAALFARGLSPYFIFPALLAALLMLLTLRRGRGLALFLAALAMALVWIGFAASGEAIMGLSAHPLFTLPVAFGLIGLLPVMAAENMPPAFWRGSVLVSLLVALAAASIAGMEPAYSVTAPERLNLTYLEKDGNSWWLADPVGRLPASLRTAAFFSLAPEQVEIARGYDAAAAGTQLPMPAASMARTKKRITMRLFSADGADSMTLIVSDGLAAVTVGGVRVAAPHGQVAITCATPDCARTEIVLDFSGPVPGDFLLAEERYGLPRKGDFLKAARPSWAVPSGRGDVSVAVENVIVPGGF